MNERVLTKILQGRSDANIGFNELRSLLLDLGFVERTRGSHHIFRKSGVEDPINIQRDGRQAKPYQIRQIRAILVKHQLGDLPDA